MVKATLENILQGTYPWLYPLELPAEETHMRLACMAAEIPWHKYIHNTMSRDEQKLIREVSSDLDELGAYKIVQPPQGERSIDELVGRAQDAGAGAIFVDQLQYVEVGGKSLGAWNETGKYWEALDRARNVTDHICFAHQFNRSVMGADKMPSVQQLKGSSAIEETATLALGLWASKEMRKSKRLEVGTLITRNHDFCNWEVEVDLTRRCHFEITGVVEEDE
jgi:replicative DNA helicase